MDFSHTFSEIQAKTKASLAASFVQGITVDSSSWISFFIYWMVANINLFAADRPPTTIGPYVLVGVIGLLCRLLTSNSL